VTRISVLIADDLPLVVDALTELLRGIREVSPHTKIVALSAQFDRASVVEMVRAGAISYLIKGSAPGEIIAAIHGSVRGESNLSPEVTGKVIQELGRSLARAEELSTELSELNRMKTELVQILAHELFTPITTIQGTAATLAVSDGRLSGEEMRALADGVERAARRLRRLVSNIGAVVSLKREATLPTQAVPLGSIVNDALGELAAIDEGAIDTQISDELLVAEAWAHRALASRALVLVTENSVDFRDDAAVEVRAVGTDQEIQLEVSDHGPGIPPDQRDRIFELFTQVEWSSSRSHEGLGIGLYLAKRIMEAHGGWLVLRDHEGGGATFVLAFPRALLRSRVRDRDQAEQLGPAGDVTFEHDPQSARVELHREHVGLEPRPLEAAHHVVQMPVGHRHVREPLDDPRLILGVSAEELLPVRVGGVRVDGHDDPRDRAVHPRLPRAFPAAHASLPGVRSGLLAEVPDVPEVVVGVPVVRPLGDRAVVRAAEHVEHHGRSDSLDRLRPVGGGHPLPEPVAVLAAVVMQHRAHREREVGIGHGVGEVAGVDRARGAGGRRPSHHGQGADHAQHQQRYRGRHHDPSEPHAVLLFF
jgi:signal transduction histidine kinase